LNIGHFVPVHPDRTGVSAALDGILEATTALGHTSVVYAYDTRDSRAARAASGRNRVRERLLYASPLPVPLGSDRAARTILADATTLDGLVFHGVFTPAIARLSRLAARRVPGLPIVAYPHDPYDEGLFGNRRAVKEAWFRLFERPYLRRARFVMLSAPGQERWLRERGIETPVAVAPLGLRVAEREWAAAVRAARSVRTDGPLRCLALGRWDVYEKGLDLVAEAVGGLPGEAELRLVGPEVGARDEIEALLRRYDVRGARPDGFVDDVWAALAEADALVLASRKEGFGLVALQALASGIPVLLSRSAGIAEHLRPDDPVVLVDPDAASVRAGLRRLTDGRAELGHQALGWWDGRGQAFTYEPAAGALIAHLQALRPDAGTIR
jgi:glycosyltransferase involved in cell wall biosynthesis